MQPINRISIADNGGDEERIGPNRRNPLLEKYHGIEPLLEALCPLAVTFDVRYIHPPFFKEFGYTDCMGGIVLHTLSAEINCRLIQRASKEPAQAGFPISQVMDKYELDSPPRRYGKVVFLPGSNALSMMDQSILQRIMQDEDWFIKPHPVTNDEDLRKLGIIYGYHRIIEPKFSGIAILKTADAIATTSSSEIFLVARYLGKPVADLTRFDRSWLTLYFPYTRLLNGDDADRGILDRAFSSRLCGYIRPEHSESKKHELINNYYSAAMQERERFRLITNQKLDVSDNTVREWA